MNKKIIEVLEKALHELTVLNGLTAADSPNEVFEINTSEITSEIRDLISELSTKVTNQE